MSKNLPKVIVLMLKLKNKNYTGDFVWNGRTYNGKYQPLITKEEFYRVQDKLGYPNKPNYRKHEHTYQRLIKCAKCRCLVSPDGQRGAHKSGNYVYIHVITKRKH